jgi:DNA ligase-1
MTATKATTTVDLAPGEEAHVQGSGSARYTLKNTGGVYSCTCPAWRNQSVAIEKRTCKHLRRLRGDGAEDSRVGASGRSASTPASKRATDASNASVGEPEKVEPPLLLAHKWETDVDLTGWWMSEKLDGVRAYWTGACFLSRLGNRFHAPAWFTKGLPTTPLDGELWLGRKKFQRTTSIVRRQDQSDAWQEVSFVIFDAPAHGGPFEDRVTHCQGIVQRHAPPHARALDHVRCSGADHLRRELTRVEALGGEGLMMRQPRSLYEVGRSATLLKVKTFLDAEARVVEHLKGAGRHKGRLGAVLVELANGTRFSVGTGFADKEREAPPPIGSIINFRYQELSDAGVPRFPSFVGVRDDVRWPAAAPKNQS